MAACVAGAWPRFAEQTLPKKTSWMSSGFTPARSTAAGGWGGVVVGGGWDLGMEGRRDVGMAGVVRARGKQQHTC